MKLNPRATAALALLALLPLAPLAAQAEEVRVTVTGVVDFNVIAGGMAGIPSGAPVSMAFSVDSDNFLNSTSFPTRGYAVDLASFSMTVGGTSVLMDIPQPAPGSAYFVLRNNDPAIDGFFLSPGVDVDFPLSVHIPGLAPAHELSFKHTLADGITLSSVIILDAVGTYNLSTNVSSYLFGIGRFGNLGAEYVPQQLTISVVPEPASLWLMGLGGLVLWGRSGRQRA
jgi:hypothetical protein